MRNARADGGDTGDPDDVQDDRGDLWEQSGRKAAGMQLVGAHHDVEEILFEVTAETMLVGEDPTADQIREARMALNTARRVLEEFVAPAAGEEPWGEPMPDIPVGVLWEMTDHPRAEGVDPREYLDDAPEETDE
jgi:hypothetical protein